MIVGKADLDKKFENMASAELRSGISKGVIHVQSAAKLLCGGFIRSTGELRGSIYTDVQESGDVITGTCFTNKTYAPFVEFGTGPKGQANHVGISPDVAVAYTQSPWWIHEGDGENEVDRETAEAYGWFYIDTPDGRFYQCSGQPAKPFMYPALKDNEEAVVEIIAESIRRQL